MRTLQLLEDEDIIYPCDFIRPLTRYADVDPYSDAWHDTNSYGGGPMDHLRWSWVWLTLGEHWWGEPWGDFLTKRSHPFQYEAVRGPLPKEHILSWTRWQHRHPLFHAFYLKKEEEVNLMTFGFGKFADYPISKLRRYEPSYVRWAVANARENGNPTVALLRWLDKYKNGSVYSHGVEKFNRINTARPPVFSMSLE